MTPEQKIADCVAEVVEYHLSAAPPFPCKHYQTAIERLLYLALFWSEKAFIGFRPRLKERFEYSDPEDGEVSVYPQFVLEGCRLDYLFAAKGPDGGVHKLAVECDGHDFHERTKEQAQRDRSRDRAYQVAGVKIFRFTGSEIYRDPCGCAIEILEWAVDITTGRPRMR